MPAEHCYRIYITITQSLPLLIVVVAGFGAFRLYLLEQDIKECVHLAKDFLAYHITGRTEDFKHLTKEQTLNSLQAEKFGIEQRLNEQPDDDVQRKKDLLELYIANINHSSALKSKLKEIVGAVILLMVGWLICSIILLVQVPLLAGKSDAALLLFGLVMAVITSILFGVYCVYLCLDVDKKS